MMNFFGFGNRTPKEQLTEIMDLADKIESKDEGAFDMRYNTTIEFDSDDDAMYYPIGLQGFLDCEQLRGKCGNLRPRLLEITIHTEDDVKTECAFIHTPLVDDAITELNMSKLTNRKKFTRELFLRCVPRFTETFVDCSDPERIVDIGINQLVNVNVLPYKAYNLCIGGLYLVIDRKSNKKKITFTIQFKLIANFNPY